MQYLKNVEITKQFPVSESTVRKWIKAAQEGRSRLTLIKVGEREYIANTTGNVALIGQLVEEGRKYRNAIASKIITPQRSFYKLFTEPQVYDIVTELELHNEISRQYNYMDGGAASWDAFAKKLASEDVPNVLKGTIQLVDKNLQYIDFLLENYDRINVVDIGVGNALPVQGLLAHLVERKKMGRYFALDISSEMLDIAKQNITSWFGNDVPFEGYELDINYDRFSNLLAQEYLKKDAEKTANIILLLGGTLCNFREPDGGFRIIKSSMGSRDYLLHSQKLDSELTRRHFDFSTQPGEQVIPKMHGLVVELLNIDPSLYNLELGFDEAKHQRYERIKFKVAVAIRFEFAEGERIVEFNKGDTVLIWRSWQQTATDVTEQLNRNGFRTLHTSQTEDGDYMLSVSKVKFD